MAANTYVQLDKVTITSATDTINFTGVSLSYTDLVLVYQGATAAAANIFLRVGNSVIDVNSNYSITEMQGGGTSAASSRLSNQTEIRLTEGIYVDANEQCNIIMNFQNYSNTTTNKTILSRANSVAIGLQAAVSMYRSTSAINTIRVYASQNFNTGSTFSLYGIAKGAAVATTAKATGGTITFASDGYTYHTFTSSGTFTPSQALTDVDYLVIAGGGGGSRINAGGGAGGLRSTVDVTGGLGTLETKLSLANATAYTVTIGQGGPGGTGTTNSPGTSGNSSSIIGGAVSITSVGGGGGGSYVQSSGSSNGLSGGSGGGAGFNEVSTAGTGGAGTTGQGFAGGNGSVIYSSGGGGGAGGVGVSGISGSFGGNGGIGVRIPTMARATTTGVQDYYAGGGGAGDEDYNANAGSGGLGGGGNGANRTGSTTRVDGSAGTANTGGGGGGGENGGTNGFNGGSGLVIIRYAN